MAGASTALQIFGTMMAYQSSQDAASAQRKAAAEAERMGIANAAAIESETMEETRRSRIEMSATEATARARAAASGVVASEGTMGEAITGMEVEHGRQLDWMRTSGKTRANIARAGGVSAGATGRAQASGTAAAGTATAFRSAPSIYKSGTTAGWWS